MSKKICIFFLAMAMAASMNSLVFAQDVNSSISTSSVTEIREEAQVISSKSEWVTPNMCITTTGTAKLTCNKNGK